MKLLWRTVAFLMIFMIAVACRQQTLSAENVTIASEDDMNNMNHDGETSAVYMSITNNGEEAVTIVSIETGVAQVAEVHETLVENDVARMQPIEALVIEAGKTVDLMPGRKHIMLMQLTQDIIVDETIDMSFVLDSGDRVMLTALVQDMLMDDLDDITQVGDLVFSNLWARPASAGDMND